MIKVGIGISEERSELSAGIEASKQALRQSGKPDFCFVFADAEYDQQRLLNTIRNVVGNIRMIGCSGMGVLSNKGSMEKGVVVLTLNSKYVKFKTAVTTNKKEREAGRDIVKRLLKQEYKLLTTVFVKTNKGFVPVNPYAVIEFLDPFIGNAAEIMKGFADVLGPSFLVIGGSAGDNRQFKKTYQYCDWKVYTKAIVGTFIQSEFPVGYGVGHGWKPVSKPYVVTKSKANVIYKIDNKPAIQIYKEFFGKKVRQIIKQPLGSLALENPIGMPTISGNYILRHPFTVKKDGSIVMSGEVPEQSVIRIMHATPKDNVKAAEDAAKNALKMLGRAKPAMALVIDCGARYMLRGQKVADKEIEAIKKVVGDIPIAGFFTYGEQAPVGGGPAMLLNETIDVVLLGKEK